MARRSARLQKGLPAPADTSMVSNSSWQTASSLDLELSTIPEPLDATAITPPRKALTKPQQLMSKLPQATPKSSKTVIGATASHTPKNRTPIKPTGQEMHPALYHASTARPLDEARWLGFQALGAYTTPPKTLSQSTPSKTSASKATNNSLSIKSSPDFRFRFKPPLSMMKASSQNETGLSPSSSRILKDAAISGTPGGGNRALFGASEFSTKADMSLHRKKAEAKGKMSRFSDVHLQQFKKMDSIANHASAFRATPGRAKPNTLQKVKAVSSKSDLAKTNADGINATESLVKPTSSLKRTISKADMRNAETTQSSATLKRTQSKIDLSGSGLPRVQATVRLIPPTRDGCPSVGSFESNLGAKRVKRAETDDAATTRPILDEVQADIRRTTATPVRKITSQTALPRLAARLMSPTKSSIARAQSAKAVKSKSMIPSLLDSPSTHSSARLPLSSSLFSPSQVAQKVRDQARESYRKANLNLQRVRSILRTPSRKYSEDPAQVAAGTHASPPPVLNFDIGLPQVPATAPVKKHVVFSNSTLARDTNSGPDMSPSPMKFRDCSEIVTGAVQYPPIQSTVEYPELPKPETPSASPSRRLTFGGDIPSNSRQFSFSSGEPVHFGPTPVETIRMVRKSDAASVIDRKRKLDIVEESSDKENSKPEEELRSTKKMRPTPSVPPKTPVSNSKLPRRTPGRSSAMSMSRLAFLATPKRNKV